MYEVEKNVKAVNPLATYENIKQLIESADVVASRAFKCDESMRVYVQLGSGVVGYIDKDKFELAGHEVKNIEVISKVGSKLCFKVIGISEATDEQKSEFGVEYVAELSRADAQKECYDNYISKLKPGDVINAHVESAQKFGLFCDIGYGYTALLPADCFCETRVNDTKKELAHIKDIKAVVKYNENGRIQLTHKELLGTWNEEAGQFHAGETVMGVVNSITDFGMFIALTPNLAGLASIEDGVNIGDIVSVYVRAVCPDRMKVKLSYVSSTGEHVESVDPNKIKYKVSVEHIDEWKYSPDESTREIKTVFDGIRPEKKDKTVA